MMPAAAVWARAEEYLGCPWRHQGRSKTHGVDCIGLVVCVMRDLGLPIEDDPTYTRQPVPAVFWRAAHGALLRWPKAEPGGVVVLRFGEGVAHVGILGPALDLIHASEPAGRVVRHRLDPARDRPRGFFRLPEVDYG